MGGIENDMDKLLQDEHINEIISHKHWNGPLEQFALSTGFVVSLYNSFGTLVSGPHTPNPISKRYQAAGIWSETGMGRIEELKIFERVKESHKVQKALAFDKLPILGMPLFNNSKLIGVLILGWMFDHFADPVETDRLAKDLSIPQLELWSLVRQHVPLSESKLNSYAELLKTISQSLILELINNQAELKTSRILRILNQSALELTAAFSIADIEQAASKAARELTYGGDIKIHFTSADGILPTGAASPQHNLYSTIQDAKLRVPIESSDSSILGIIEVQLPTSSGNYESELSALASQVAVAFQKVKLISDLQKERGHLKFTLEELRRASLVRDQFLTTLSHELRTPLTAVLGWCQILKDENLDYERASFALQTIERNAKAQAQLIEDLLDASRIISGKMLMNIELGDLIAVVQDSIKTIKPTAEKKRITITLEKNVDKLIVYLDPVRIQQIFWNLLSNAVKFTPNDGKIQISISKEEHSVSVRVTDSGVGIKPEFLGMVFDRFSQADSSYARTYGGLGLGLAIVKQLIELHGGSVEVDSLGENQGTSFIIRFPIGEINAHLQKEHLANRQSSISASLPGSGATEKPNLDGVKILIVDDTEDTLQLIKLFTKKEGAIIETATSVDEGIQKFHQFKPDIIISDISMPGRDGFSFILELKDLMNLENRIIPVVAVTAYTGEEDKQRVLNSGFAGHIGKPIHRQVLIKTISDLQKAYQTKILAPS